MDNSILYLQETGHSLTVLYTVTHNKHTTNTHTQQQQQQHEALYVLLSNVIVFFTKTRALGAREFHALYVLTARVDKDSQAAGGHGTVSVT